jgi:hypothetical protein
MSEPIDKIRRLLDDLEEQMAPGQGNCADPHSLPATEISVVIQEIVDDLQPLLTPYDIAFYWHLFRHSIARDGNPLVRVSTRGLQAGVVKSSHGDTIALQKVRGILAALESIGAIRKEGEPNRDGTPYRVLIPDEIEACRKFRTERKAGEPKAEVADDDVDYYNVRENRIKVYERDGYKCRYCEKQLTRFTCTLDHVTPVAAGGKNNVENLVTACLDCNSRKHRRPVGDFLADQ